MMFGSVAALLFCVGLYLFIGFIVYFQDKNALKTCGL